MLTFEDIETHHNCANLTSNSIGNIFIFHSGSKPKQSFPAPKILRYGGESKQHGKNSFNRSLPRSFLTPNN